MIQFSHLSTFCLYALNCFTKNRLPLVSIIIMPYLQQAYVQVIRDMGQPSHGSASSLPSSSTRSMSVSSSHGRGLRTLRSIPHDEENNGAPQAPGASSASGTYLEVKSGSPGDETGEQKSLVERLQEMNITLCNQIEALFGNSPAQSTHDDAFSQYNLQVDTVMFSGKYSNIYLATRSDHPECTLMGRVFEPASKIDPQRSMYLKILKHLGKKHPSLMATWDIFFDQSNRVVIFQEYAGHGNLQEYIKQNNVYLPEQMMADWAKQIYLAMDYLGNAGICHRAINPKHILLTSARDEANRTLVKLGSFRDAIIYYDLKNGTVRNQPCRPLEKRKLANYQAPEVFGSNSEEYCPIAGDIWSYGATFFFVATRMYPFRYKADVKDISLDIQQTVEQASMLSPDAKRWFAGILCADASRRTMFDKIEVDPWYKAF